jgi:hypothetical protein
MATHQEATPKRKRDATDTIPILKLPSLAAHRATLAQSKTQSDFVDSADEIVEIAQAGDPLDADSLSLGSDDTLFPPISVLLAKTPSKKHRKPKKKSKKHSIQPLQRTSDKDVDSEGLGTDTLAASDDSTSTGVSGVQVRPAKRARKGTKARTPVDERHKPKPEDLSAYTLN